METIKVTKMQGCGNDFVIIDFEEFQKSKLSMEELARKICNRNFGVGADGMIIPNTNTTNTDIGWYFYNSDGTTAQMCGNGMRCFAKYAYDKGLVNQKQFSVETLAGVIKPEILEDGQVRVDMGAPILEDEKIPFKGEKTIQVKSQNFEITPISMGNPHCIIFTNDDPMLLAQTYGADIEKHQYFPEKTNTEFVRVLSKNNIEMRVYERGCGITLACGTGACASVVACILNNLTENNVLVNLLGGVVSVEWQGSQLNLTEHVFLTGPANYSFIADYML